MFERKTEVDDLTSYNNKLIIPEFSLADLDLTLADNKCNVILFQEDWDKVPDAIVHMTTKNESFIRFARLLKAMGIKNNAFCLQLHNPELEFVDPFDYANLTVEQMMAINVECYHNPFYLFRECLRIPGSDSNNPVRFQAHRGNMALLWCFLNHVMTILIQIRQTGKSFACDCIVVWLLNFGLRQTTINLLTKDETLRTANLDRLKRIEAELPFYLKKRIKGDVSNTEEIRISSLGNRLISHLPNKSPKYALNVGRGLTSEVFLFDETAFFYNVEITLPAALAAGTARRDFARQNGTPYGTILATTAGKKDDKDGRFVYDAVINSAEWSEAMYDAVNMFHLHKIIRVNNPSPKRELRVNCTFNHRQLGKTDEWLDRAIEEAMVSGDAADRDFFNVWTDGGILNPLTTEELDRIKKSQFGEAYCEIDSKTAYIIRWYADRKEINYLMSDDTVMSLDTSDASGGDDIGLHIRHVKTGATLAAGNYNETNLIVFAEWIADMMERFPKMILIPERRSSAAAIIDYLLLILPSKKIDPFKRIYNKIVQDQLQFKNEFAEVNRPMSHRRTDIYVRYKKFFGFATSGSGLTSRTELYSTTLKNAVKTTGDLVRDKRTIDQIMGLENRNGRVDHAEGQHDDLVIAWLLSYWFISLGANLGFYGIDTRNVLSQNRINLTDNSPMKKYENKYNTYIKQKIDEVAQCISDERDEYVCQRYKLELQRLYGELNEDSKRTLTLEDLLEKVNDRRRSKLGLRK